MTFEANSKTSQKMHKAPTVAPHLLCQIVDAEEAGWVNVTNQPLKFKTDDMRGTTLKPFSRKEHGLHSVFSRVFSNSLLKFMHSAINKEMGRRRSQHLGDAQLYRRNRLHNFDETEHRLCFAFAIVHLAHVDSRNLDGAWDSFKARLANTPFKLDKWRAYTWRSCLSAIPLDCFVDELKRETLKMVELGTLLAVDESLFRATAQVVRFWECVIQFIKRKPHPLRHLM